MYSVASRDTFNRVESIIRRVRRVKEDAMQFYGGTPYASPTSATSAYTAGSASSVSASAVPIVILGNKRDVGPASREVQPEEGQRLAQRFGCEFFETSAKNGFNVEQAFKTVVRGIKVAKGGGEPNAAGAAGGSAGASAARRRERRSKKCIIL